MEADYGIDWDGPHEPDNLEGVAVPDVQLPRNLTAEETAGLPNRDVALMDAVDLYTATVAQLNEILTE